MEAYANWVRRNKDYVQSLESIANGMTWFVPDRFASSEIGLEAASSLVGIISVINQYIIDSAPTKYLAVPSSFPFSLCLSVVKELEILVEVIAEYYYGDDKKWNFIAITEGIKVLLRLSLFRQSGYKMLLQGGGVTNADSEGNDSSSQKKISELSKTSELQSSSSHVQKSHRAENRALTLVNQVDGQIHMVKPPALSKKGVYGGLFLTGELLAILRPFIYSLCMKKYGRRSWIPWVISLALDLAGMFASLIAKLSKQIVLSITEKDELKRRRVILALYLMRDPFFCKYTRTKIESTQKTLEPVPVVGMFTEKIFELIYGVQSRFSYISGS